MDDIREDQEDRGASLSATGLSSASPMGPQASRPKASIPSAVWVVVRSSGEYSDRVETPIRFCLTEDDAKRAVDLTSIEAQRDEKPPRRYIYETAYEMPDGSLLPDNTDFMDPRVRAAKWKLTRKPDADEIKAQNTRWEAEYDAAIAALDHVDPEGSWRGDDYYYAQVTLWPASAIETATAETAKQGSVHESAVAKPDAKTPSGDSL